MSSGGRLRATPSLLLFTFIPSPLSIFLMVKSLLLLFELLITMTPPLASFKLIKILIFD